MKQRLITLLSKVPGNGPWAQSIRDNLNNGYTDTMLKELKCAALDNGAYWEKKLGKEAYELLLEVEI